MTNQLYQVYLGEIQKNLSTGNATEHSHRAALQRLLESVDNGITVINEPRRIECGSPDLGITRGAAPVGYMEAKNIGESLKDAGRSEQLRRYRASLPNLILTDYLEFWWYVDDERREVVRLAEIDDDEVKEIDGGAQALSELLGRFLGAKFKTVSRPKDLAERMAGLARLTRKLIEETFQHETDKGSLHAQYNSFLEVLIPDLTHEQFADMYAQTIAYGLFAARCNFTGETFTREHAAHDLPKTNPFLRKLFVEIAGPDLDDRIAWSVDEQANLLDKTNMAAILKDFGKRTERKDPVVHFYETFLAKYDAKMRKSRGVYYTPEPVVWYIVRSIDHLLKTRLNRPDGLADKDTLILDPACGTGTFLFAVIDLVRETFAGNEGMWNGYVRDHLLRRIFGFELLMAPYAVTHMKLGIQLQDSGYKFESDERLRIYLTNALEEATKKKGPMFSQWIADEADAATHVKRDDPVLIVLGNPPYSGHSANRSKYIDFIQPGNIYTVETEGKRKERKAGKKGVKLVRKTFIGELIEDYKQVDGQPLNEKNPKWLQDDYVKFIRFAQWRIQRTGEGIIGYITNHGYLDNPTFRGMRQSLMETFNEIYIYDLHGNLKKREKTPEGGKDDNIFDIQPGVAIMLCVKEKGNAGPARIYHADLWGLRKAKYGLLAETDVGNMQWTELEPSSPFYLFVPQNTELLKEYDHGWKITEIFPVNSVGVITARDSLTIHWNSEQIWQTVMDFATLPPEAAREKYRLGKDVRDWKVELAQRDLRASGQSRDNVIQMLYRPFDVRYSYYTGKSKGFHCMPRGEIMRHMLAGENIAIYACRQIVGQSWRHILATNRVTEFLYVSGKTRENGYVLPLYLYPNDSELAFHASRRPNLSPAFLKALAEKLNLPQSKPNGLPEGLIPENILHYAYAVLHSPTYRERYAEFLKRDFPRLPLTSDIDLFRKLADVGKELVALHLMESPLLDNLITQYPVGGSDEVEKVSYVEQDQRVYINSEQYFQGVPPEVCGSFALGAIRCAENGSRTGRGGSCRMTTRITISGLWWL